MHTYDDEETGVRVHHNGDYSGNAIIWIPTPDGPSKVREFEVPAMALVRFGAFAALDKGLRMAIEELDALHPPAELEGDR